MPHDQLCRGCAGTGVDHSVSDRTRQLIMREHVAIRVVHSIRKDGQVERSGNVQHCYVQVSAVEQRERLRYHGPLASAVEEIEKRVAEGYDFRDKIKGLTHAVLPEQSHACGWCHGTGRPQLSVHTLAIGVST